MRTLRRTLQLMSLFILWVLLAKILPASNAIKASEWGDEAALLEVKIQLNTRFVGRAEGDISHITGVSSNSLQQQQAVQQQQWSLQVEELVFSSQESTQKRRVLHEDVLLSVQWSRNEQLDWNGAATSRLVFPLEQYDDSDVASSSRRQ